MTPIVLRPRITPPLDRHALDRVRRLVALPRVCECRGDGCPNCESEAA